MNIKSRFTIVFAFGTLLLSFSLAAVTVGPDWCVAYPESGSKDVNYALRVAADEVSGMLTFGDAASVLVEDPLLLGRAVGRVVASATGGISLPQSLEKVNLDPSGVYQLKRVSDTELAVIRSPRFYMIIR